MKDTENQDKKDTHQPRFEIYEPQGEVTSKILLLALTGKKSNTEIMNFYNQTTKEPYPTQTGVKNKMTPKQRTIKEKSIVKPLNRKLMSHPEIQYVEEINYSELKIKPNADNSLKATTCDNSLKWLIANNYLRGTPHKFEINYSQLLIDTILMHEGIAFVEPEVNKDIRISMFFLKKFVREHNIKRANLYKQKAQSYVDSFLKTKTLMERFEILRKEVPEEVQKYYLEYFLILNEAEQIFPSKTDFNYLFNNTKTMKSLLLFGYMYVLARMDSLKTASEEVSEYAEELHRRQGIICYMLEHSNEESQQMIENLNNRTQEMENKINYLSAKEAEKGKKLSYSKEEETLNEMKKQFKQIISLLSIQTKSTSVDIASEKKVRLILQKAINKANEQAPEIINQLIAYGKSES